MDRNERLSFREHKYLLAAGLLGACASLYLAAPSYFASVAAEINQPALPDGEHSPKPDLLQIVLPALEIAGVGFVGGGIAGEALGNLWRRATRPRRARTLQNKGPSAGPRTAP